MLHQNRQSNALDTEKKKISNPPSISMSGISLFDKKKESVTLDFSISNQEVELEVKKRSDASPIKPNLVMPEDLKSKKDYNRFKDEAKKSHFRQKLLDTLKKGWQSNKDSKIIELTEKFIELTKGIDDSGALIIGDLIERENFKELVQEYDKIFKKMGSESWIHSYVNFGNQPDFLNTDTFKNAFLHPILVSLIAYAAGGPIRIVDARGKDAEPLAVRAQDNMLHIDNTPFRREFKIILTWERGKASGPKGQNFVFIPGTHKGVRDSFLDEQKNSWSTEDASIFITKESINQVFHIQKKAGKGLEGPEVVEVQDPERPVTTVFEAGALVHHRYRTKEKNVPRSCMIIAFHRSEDNPGQLISEEHVKRVTKEGSLARVLFGKYECEKTEHDFLLAIENMASIIADKILEITDSKKTEGSIIIEQHSKTLDEKELEKWKDISTDAPTVEEIKIQKQVVPLKQELDAKSLSEKIIEFMKFDKHGPLDLKLYGDGHEEIRKWARNRVREMPYDKLKGRFKMIFEMKGVPVFHKKDLMTPEKLKLTTDYIVSLIDGLTIDEKNKAKLDSIEKISAKDAYRSMRQLFVDLGDAIVRCDSRQAFLSTSLFIFLACDELSQLRTVGFPELKPIKNSLLLNYISTVILMEKHIHLQRVNTLQKAWKTVCEESKDMPLATHVLFQNLKKSEFTNKLMLEKLIKKLNDLRLKGKSFENLMTLLTNITQFTTKSEKSSLLKSMK